MKSNRRPKLPVPGPWHLARTLVLLTALGLAPALQRLHAGQPTPSDGLDDLRLLTKESFGRWTLEGQRELLLRFRKLLNDIACADTNGLTVSWQETTLMRLARDITNHWERFDELLTTYGVPRDRFPAPRVILPPALKSTHVDEAYRPAWEALILAPETAEIRFMQSVSLITDALARIGNTNSLPVLQLAFLMSCEKGAGGDRTLQKQFRILKSLNYFARTESLEVMLQCLSNFETNDQNLAKKYEGFDLYEWVFRFLADKDRYGTGEKWRQILKSFPKQNLPPKQRALLERAMQQ